MNRRRERGFLIVVALILIILVAMMVTTLGSMVATEFGSGASSASGPALDAAEAGVERANQQFGAGTACGSLINTSVVAGAGTFTTSGTLYSPTPTTLSAAIIAADTTIPVASITGYAPRGQVRIDNEDINYGSTSTVSATCGGTAPCLLNAQRGATGSTVAPHVVNSQVAQEMCVVTSTGTQGAATRVVQRGIRLPGAMYAYAQANATSTPFYRRWNGTAWGPPLTASSVAATINFMVLKFARTRNEAILGVQNSTGAITVQTWDGAAWSAATAIGTATSPYRGFDIQYEQNSDRAMIVYYAGTAAQFSYRIWDGSSWAAPATQALPAGFGAIRWLELARNPLATSNEMALMMTNNGGANAGHVYGLRWTGSAWNNMGVAAEWDTTAGSTATKLIDVAYEQQSGNILFVWGKTTDTQLYRAYRAGTLDLANRTLTITDQGGTPNWIRLAPDPTTDNIMYAVTDTGGDFETRMWVGASNAWDCSLVGAGACNASHPEHSGTVESFTDQVFDVAFETHPSNAGIAWIFWGDNAGTRTTFSRRWSSAASAWAAKASVPGSDRTKATFLLAHPFKDSGAVLGGIYETTGSANQDIRSTQLTPAGGSAWSALNQIWNGGVVNPYLGRMSIAAERSLVTVYSIEVYP